MSTSFNPNTPIDGAREALWMATAVTAPPTEQYVGNQHCDVAIVGAGFTGLNAALYLAKSGLSVSVLDAVRPGFGASGRSGGQVNLGLNEGPKQLINRFGETQAQRLIQLILNTPQFVFDHIKEHQLNCDAVQQGWIQGALSSKILERQQSLAQEYDTFTVDNASPFKTLNQDRIIQMTGTKRFVGGLLCEQAGSLHPLSYTRELARSAMASGAKVFHDSPVTGISKQANGYQVHTKQGTLTASKVLLCTNGYTDQQSAQPFNALTKAVVPVRTILVATEPLSQELQNAILPNKVTLVDKRRIILYLRYDRDGRLCIGNHGPSRDEFKISDFDYVKKQTAQLFPELANTRWDFHWGGRIAVTKTGLPFMHEIAPGLIAGMGYNGRGVGMGTMMGIELAKTVLSEGQQPSDIPLTKPKPYLMHRFNEIGVAGFVKWYSLLDYIDKVNR